MEQVIRLVREAGIIRPRDLRARGIHPEILRRLHARGILIRSGWGLYMLADAPVTEHHALAEVCKRIPKAVVCLLSALRFHGMTTLAPHEVWITLDRKADRPRVDYPPIRVVRFSGEALTEGVEQHQVEGVTVSVYSPAKTVVDCFKYRNKIGLDVALEALRDGWRGQRFTMDELWHYGRICRVANIMRPYLETLTL